MRKIAERSENDYGYKIYKNEFNEFTVKFFFKGMHICGADYFTHEERDALSTAKRQLTDWIRKEMERGA